MSVGRSTNSTRAAAVLFLIGASIPAAQYGFRLFDDNNLVSWNLLFPIVNPFYFALALTVSLILGALSLRISMPNRLREPFLALLFAAAAMSAWSLPEINIDASRYFSQAKHLELYGAAYFFREWGGEIAVWTDLPGLPFLYGMIFTLFGESRANIQLFSTLLFALSAVLTYRIGSILWNDDTGFSAALLLLGMPYLFIMTPLMLVDLPALFFLLLSVYLFIRVLTDGGWLLVIAASLSIFFTSCCKYSMWPMLSVFPVISFVFFMTHEGETRNRLVRRSLLVLIIFMAFFATFLALKFGVVSRQIELLMHFQLPGLGRWHETFRSTLFFQINPLITIAAFASLFVALWKRDIRYLIIAWLPFLIVFFQIRRIRYALPVFPLLALMASYGFNLIADRTYRKAVVVSIVCVSLATSFFAYIPFLSRTSFVNLQQAGAFLDALDVDAVEVFPLPQQKYPVNPAISAPMLDLYTKKRIIFHYEPGLSSPDQDINRSPYRFSWEYRNPVYYREENRAVRERRAAVLISPDKNIPLDTLEIGKQLETFENTKAFTTGYRVAGHRTHVKIFW